MSPAQSVVLDSTRPQTAQVIDEINSKTPPSSVLVAAKPMDLFFAPSVAFQSNPQTAISSAETAMKVTISSVLTSPDPIEKTPKSALTGLAVMAPRPPQLLLKFSTEAPTYARSVMERSAQESTERNAPAAIAKPT